MGFNDGFRMGMSLLDSIDAAKQRTQENAWRQQQMDAWQADQDFKTAERNNFLGLRKKAMSAFEESDSFSDPAFMETRSDAVDPQGTYRPAYDSQAASVGAPTERRTAVKIMFTPEQLREQGLTREMLGAATDMQSLASLQETAKKQRAFHEGMSLRSYLNSLDDNTFNDHIKDLSDTQRNGYKMEKGKNGYITVTVDEGKPIKMNREQATEWLSSRHVYNKTNDPTALARMEKIDKRLADQAKETYDRSIGAAGANNTATHYANSDANNAARLGLARDAAKNKTREMSQETVQRLNDLSAQISEERDPQKRQVLMNQFNREYSVGATQMGKVLMPKVGKEDNGFGAIAQKIIEGGGDAKAVETARTAWNTARGEAPDEVIGAWMDGKDPSTGKPLSAAEKNLMATKWPSLRALGGANQIPGAPDTPPAAAGVDVRGKAQKAYEAWQAARGPWYLPTPKSGEASRLEAEYDAILRSQYK